MSADVDSSEFSALTERRYKQADQYPLSGKWTALRRYEARVWLSRTTGSGGVASFNYNLSKHAAAETYQVQFGTTVKEARPGGASTTFTVQ